MTGLIFAAAISVALATLLWRRWDQRRRLLARQRQPGYSAGNPLAVQRFDDIDRFIAAQRCSCQGRLSAVSEADTAVGTPSGRVVKTECVQCESESYFYFQLPQLLH